MELPLHTVLAMERQLDSAHHILVHIIEWVHTVVVWALMDLVMDPAMDPAMAHMVA